MKIDELGDRIVEQFDLQSGKMVVAVSTGVDSTVLINALVATTKVQNTNLIVGHVNHKLRAESDQEAAYLEKWCKKNKIQFFSTDWDVKQHPKTGVEAAARNFRYDFFERLMTNTGAKILLTAHNADEQAESFVMRLIRGGQLSELSGIPQRRLFATGVLVRPFLKIPKADLIEMAQENNLKWFEDQTNHTNDFLRNRIRNEVLPILEKENSQTVSHINQFQDQLLEQARLIDKIVEQKINAIADGKKFRLDELRSESVGWQKQILLKMIKRSVPDLAVGQNKLAELVLFINHTNLAQGTIDIGKSYCLEITYDNIQIIKKKTIKPEQVKKHMLTLNTWFKLSDKAWFRVGDRILANKSNAMILSQNQFELPLYIRPARPDDRLGLKNGGSKTIRREWIDQKIPNALRDQYFVIVDAAGTVLWVPGLRKSWLKTAFIAEEKQFMMEFRTGGRPNGQ